MKGFSLIELLIGVVIIALLTAVAVGVTSDVQQRAEQDKQENPAQFR